MSIFGDFFEQFRRRFDTRVPMDIPQDILNDIYNDCSRENEQKSPPHFGRQDTFFNSPVDFMSEFEVMFNNFFKGFPAIAFGPPAENDSLSLPESNRLNDSKPTLQERMLNDKKSPKEKFNHHSYSQIPFSVEGFRRLYNRPPNEPVAREDRNLDEDIQSGDKNLDDILPRDHVQSNFPSNFNSFGSFSSSSVTHDSNGVVERKKTVRDSRGNEEVTITRRVNGKEYTITHKTDEHGNKETKENVVDLGTENKRQDMLMPGSSPFTPSSLYERLRNWIVNED